MKVSILLPVYNAEDYIGETLSSLISQTYRDLEILVIDDGSTDNSNKIIKDFAEEDNRVRLVEQKNEGLISTLNKGLSLCKGEYIARMDADDISFANRIERQVDFLDVHSEVGIVGSSVILFGDDVSDSLSLKPENHELNLANLLFAPCFAHPSVMIRKRLIEKHNFHYDLNYQHCEDYKLWVDMAFETKLANISEPLVKYRQHPKQVSVENNHISLENHFKISSIMFDRLGLSLNYVNFLSILGKTRSTNYNEIVAVFEEIIEKNSSLKVFEERALKKVIGERIDRLNENIYGFLGYLKTKNSKISGLVSVKWYVLLMRTLKNIISSMR